MPFTPFHMGAALLLKPVARERFSVLVFGVSQVLIDIEPLARIIRGDTILHGFTHTLCGALAIGAAAAVIARVPVNAWLECFGLGRHPAYYLLPSHGRWRSSPPGLVLEHTWRLTR